MNDDNEVAIAKAGGIEVLVQLARNGSDEAKEKAAEALENLAENADNQVAIAKAKASGTEPLVQLAPRNIPTPLAFLFFGTHAT